MTIRDRSDIRIVPSSNCCASESIRSPQAMRIAITASRSVEFSLEPTQHDGAGTNSIPRQVEPGNPQSADSRTKSSQRVRV